MDHCGHRIAMDVGRKVGNQMPRWFARYVFNLDLGVWEPGLVSSAWCSNVTPSWPMPYPYRVPYNGGQSSSQSLKEPRKCCPIIFLNCFPIKSLLPVKWNNFEPNVECCHSSGSLIVYLGLSTPKGGKKNLFTFVAEGAWSHSMLLQPSPHHRGDSFLRGWQASL